MVAVEAGYQAADSSSGPTADQLKILFLIDEIGRLDGGGTERQVLELVRLARRLGYAPSLAVLRGTEWLTEERAGCPIYFARVSSFFSISGWKGLLALTRWVRAQRMAAVQTFFVECNILGPWIARLAGVPVVIGSRRNLNQWHGRTRWMGPFICRMQRFSNRSVDYIVGNSQGVVDAVVRTERIPREKTRVAYNGIDLTRFAGLEQQRASAREALGIGADEILVGNISVMRPIKGVDQFVEVARLALLEDPTLRFLIVGDGSERDAILERIRSYGIEHRFHLSGAQIDVLPYLAAMDIGVLSSLAEGFSNSLLEYMAAGLAIAATDVGGNREALEDAGILVPPEDPVALCRAILSLRPAAVRMQLGQAARVRVQRFSLGSAESAMEELYSELLRKKGIIQGNNRRDNRE